MAFPSLQCFLTVPSDRSIWQTVLQLSALQNDREHALLDAVTKDPIAGEQPVKEVGLQHLLARCQRLVL